MPILNWPAPGESFENAIDITALVKKNLNAGKNNLGFAFIVDKELKKYGESCMSSYASFLIEIKTKK